jgi:hypothetical protein
MRMFCHDHQEAINEVAQPGSPLAGIRRSVILCGLAVAMAAPAVWAEQAPAAAAPTPRKTHRVVKPQPAVPESIPEVTMPAPPPPARRAPEQMPPGVPQVSWDGSQLTITADNSTLADILVAIRTRTGAEIDVPANSSRERIAARLGPGPARDVIATLLSWTDYDYIIQASDTDPLAIQSVLLTPRGKSDDVVASAARDAFKTSAPRASHKFGQPTASPAETPVQESSGSTDPETSTEPVAAAQPARTEPQPAAAVVPPAAPEAPPAQAEALSAPVDIPPTQANLNAVPAAAASDLSLSSGSSTDERIQQMQNLYQQRKQMVQEMRKAPPAN